MKIKKSIIVIAIAFFLMIAVVLFGIYIQNKDVINSVRFVVNSNSTSENISLFNNEGKYYAFLPSYADFDSTFLDYSVGCSVYIDDKYYSFETPISELQTDKEYIITIKNSIGVQIAKETLVVMKSANIPALSIHLINGTIDDINSDKTIEKTGTCTLITEDKSINYKGSFDSIHGRGNSSWGQQKKPYALEFTENTNLLNIGSNKNWVLVANAMDESNIRDKIIYDAAKRVGLSYSVGSEYVDLYIDDIYYGLYLLTEKIEVSENRINISDLYSETQKVNQKSLKSYDTFIKENEIYMKAYDIPNNPSDISGGYLVELELAGRVNDENNLFRTKSQQNVTVKFPACISKDEMEYISTVFQNAEENLEKSEVFDIIDLNSWVNYYLTQEIFSNTSSTSFFFYKDKDSISKKIYAGPIWDFDLALGTVYESNNSSPDQFYVNTWGWYEKLYKNPIFFDAVKQEYNSKYREIIIDIIDNRIKDYSKIISSSYLMNEKRWKNIQSNWWVNHYDSQKEHVDYLRDYLSKRIEFLDSVWGDSSTLEPPIYQSNSNKTVESVNLENDAQELPEETSIIVELKTFVLKNRELLVSVLLFLIIVEIIFINIIVDIRNNRRYKDGK